MGSKYPVLTPNEIIKNKMQIPNFGGICILSIKGLNVFCEVNYIIAPQEKEYTLIGYIILYFCGL